MVSTVHRFGCSPLLVSRVSSVPTNRPPSLPLSYSPTLAHPLIPLFYSLLFFSPLDALLFPSFLLPSLSLLFYSAITRLLFSLSFSLFSLILAYPPFLYCTLPILFSFLLSLCRFSFSLLLSSTFGRLLSITPRPFFSSRLISSLPSASETKRRSLAAFLCLPLPLLFSRSIARRLSSCVGV